MSFRFLKITAYYGDFLRAYYHSFPWVKHLPYSQQYDHLQNQRFAWSNYYETNLRSLGIEAYEIIYNAKPLQNAWAKDHGCNLKNGDLVLEQIKRLKPDVLFLQDSFMVGDRFVQTIRQEVSSIKIIIGWCCAPYSLTQSKMLASFDFLLTCTPYFVEQFKKMGYEVFLLNHAFESTLLSTLKQPIGSSVKTDIIFTGSLIAGDGFHNIRRDIINNLLDSQFNIQVFSRIPSEGFIKLKTKQLLFDVVAKFKRRRLEETIKGIPIIRNVLRWEKRPQKDAWLEQIKDQLSNPVYGLEMLRAITNSKIGFNSHIDIAGDYAGNSRLFETTGTGTCLLTDHKKNISKLFEVDREIVTYTSPEEAVEKIKWLLQHPKAMEKIAIAGQKRTLRDHTFYHRAQELRDIIQRFLN